MQCGKASDNPPFQFQYNTPLTRKGERVAFLTQFMIIDGISEQGHRIAGTISSYFGVTPRMSGTIIADMAKQTAITR
jgi:hypothetical protein